MIELFQFLYRERLFRRSYAVVLMTLAGGARGLLVVLITNTISGTFGMTSAATIGAVLLLIYLGSAHFARMAAHVLVERMQHDMRVGLVRKLVEVDAKFFIGREKGDLYNSLTFDIANIATSAIRLMLTGQALVLGVFCFIYIFWLSPVAGLAAILLTLLAALTARFHDRKARARLWEVTKLGSDFYSRVEDALHGFVEIRLNRLRQTALFGHITDVVERARSLSLEAERYFSFTNIISQATIFAFLALVVFAMPMTGLADTQTALKLLTVALFIHGPIENTLGNYPTIARARVSVERIKALEAELAAATYSEDVADPLRFAGFRQLSLKDIVITLRRPASGGQHYAATDSDDFKVGPISLDIRRGEIVFINGANGAGKTTLFSIIAGLRQPDEGAILVDGAPVMSNDMASLRSIFAAVFSDYHLFQRLYGLTGSQMEAIDPLLRDMDLGSRVALQGDQFQPFRLSAGQRRRLALSVALAEDRPVLLLDEFAADQDALHRNFYYETLLPALRTRGKTVLAVTHDESRLELCDWLVKMENGQIASITPGRYHRPFAVPESAVSRV